MAMSAHPMGSRLHLSYSLQSMAMERTCQGFKRKNWHSSLVTVRFVMQLSAVLCKCERERRHTSLVRGPRSAKKKLGLKDLNEDKVRFVIEMVDFRKGPQMPDMYPEFRVEYAENRKEKGGGLFKIGRYELALEKYKKVVELCKETKDWPDEFKAKAKELTKASKLNQAACYLKIG